MTSIYLSRAIPEPGMAILRRSGLSFCVGHDDPETAPAPADWSAGLRSHQILLCQLTERVDAALLAAQPQLRGIAQMAVGFDNIDIAAARARGIPVSHTPGVLTEATADLAFALLLAVARRVPEAHAYTVAGRFRAWGPQLLVGAGVGPAPDGTPRTLGIVGFGRIGRAMARRARGFGMQVLVTSRRPVAASEQREFGVTAVALDELLERSDHVSLHCPATPETRRLIDAAALARMPSHAILINTARGEIVDERALVAALAAGRLGGAGLDVYEREPALTEGLAELPGVVLLPHVGSATGPVRDRMAELAATDAVAMARGEAPVHPVPA